MMRTRDLLCVAAVAVFGLFALTWAEHARGQEADVVMRPTATVTAWKAQANPDGPAPSQICLVLCGAEFLDPATHLSCATVAGNDAIAEGIVANDFADADLCYAAIALTADGNVSEPSSNRLIIQRIPLPPTVVR